MSPESLSEWGGVGMSTNCRTEVAEWKRAAEIITPDPEDQGEKLAGQERRNRGERGGNRPFPQ
jgi:hypothetical protein